MKVILGDRDTVREYVGITWPEGFNLDTDIRLANNLIFNIDDKYVKPGGERTSSFEHDIAQGRKRDQEAAWERVEVSHHDYRGIRTRRRAQVAQGRVEVGEERSESAGDGSNARRRKAPGADADEPEDVVAADIDRYHFDVVVRIPIAVTRQLRQRRGQLVSDQRATGGATYAQVVEGHLSVQSTF